MSFFIYDISFLVAFTLAVVIFLYTRKSNLKRQGLLYLYRTKIGLKLIEYTSRKYKKILVPMQHLIVACGYVLMVATVWMIVKFAWFYITSPFMAKELKVPVLMPLIPYLPSIFKLDFLPPFPFTYWIIIIALIAVPHEFAHGIFARLNKIKVKATGFGFLGPFLAAFVEPDEKKMEKAKKFPQLSILASGTFANVIMTILLLILFWAFFASAFTPAGVNFNLYAMDNVNLSDISSINHTAFNYTSAISPLLSNISLITITADNKTLFTTEKALKTAKEENYTGIQAFLDSPAFNSALIGSITSIDESSIRSIEDLRAVLETHKPGDVVKVTTSYQESESDYTPERIDYTIKLSENNGKAFLGIGNQLPEKSGLYGAFYYLVLAKIRDPLIYYKSTIGTFGWFIYHLLWWAILISFSVALVNMMPVSIFDGGRFFYLTIWGITGRESWGKKAFAFSTWFILVLISLMMAKWILAFL